MRLTYQEIIKLYYKDENNDNQSIQVPVTDDYSLPFSKGYPYNRSWSL